MKIISEPRQNINYGIIALFSGFTILVISIMNLKTNVPSFIYLLLASIWCFLFYFFIKEFIHKTIEIGNGNVETYYLSGYFLKTIPQNDITSWIITEKSSKIYDQFYYLSLFNGNKRILKINSNYYQNFDEIKAALTHKLPFNYAKKASYEAFENVGLGFTLVVFSMLLFYAFYDNIKITNSHFSFNSYEYISDKIEHSEIDLYQQGRGTRRQIIIHLQKNRFITLFISGLEKNLIDERFFTNPANWQTPMVFCIEKSVKNFKKVKGLSINNINYISAYKLFKNNKNTSPTKANLLLAISLILFSAGLNILIINWIYFRNPS